MEGTSADGWGAELERWLGPFLARLRRKEQRHWAPFYLKGLILPGERKSVEPMAARAAPAERGRGGGAEGRGGAPGRYPAAAPLRLDLALGDRAARGRAGEGGRPAPRRARRRPGRGRHPPPGGGAGPRAGG